jgi:hypothetical protein
MPWLTRNAPFIAAGIFLAIVVLLWLLMPRIMLAVSGGGPFAGLAVALLFMGAFFGVLWLRSRAQRRPRAE